MVSTIRFLSTLLVRKGENITQNNNSEINLVFMEFKRGINNTWHTAV